LTVGEQARLALENVTSAVDKLDVISVPSNLEEAIRISEAEQPDLAILAVHDSVDGSTLIRALQDADAKTCLVLVVDPDDHDIVADALDGDIWDVLVSPVTSADLLALLTRWTRHRRDSGLDLAPIEGFELSSPEAGSTEAVMTVHQLLVESEQRFRAIADLTPVMLWMSDTSGACTFFNQPWRQFIGQDDMESLLGDGWMEDVHPDDADNCSTVFHRALTERKPFTMSYRIRRHDGVFRWVLDSGKPRFLPDGTFAGFIGTCVDITEFREVDDALRESELRFRGVVEESQYGIAIVEESGDFIEWNQGLVTITGLERSEAVGRNWAEVIARFLPDAGSPVDLRQETIARLETIAGGGGPIEDSEGFDLTIVDVAGRPRVVELSLFPIRTENRRRVGVICRDVTEQKRAQKALATSEARFRALIESSEDHIFMLDPQGVYMTSNRRVAHLGLGVGASVVGLRLEEVYPPDVADLYRAHLVDVSITRQPITFEHPIPGDGEDYHHIDTLYPIERDGEVWAIGGICRDITQQKVAEEMVRREARRAEALARVAFRLNGQMQIEEIFQTVCEEAVKALDVDSASLLLYNPKREALSLAHTLGLPAGYAEDHSELSLRSYQAFSDDGVVLIEDTQDVEGLPNRELYRRYDIRTLIGTVMTSNEKMIGGLGVYTIGVSRSVDESEVQLLRAIADQAAQAIVRAQLIKKLRDTQVRLRSLSKRLVQVQETERQRLASELHDGMGQALAAMRVDLQSYLVVEDAESQADLVERDLSIMDGMLQQIRDLSIGLRPSLLDDLGLVPALRWYVDRIAQQTGVSVLLKSSAISRPLSYEAKTACYRVTQEALNNAVRHGRATSIVVDVREEDSGVVLRVEDDGVGFDVSYAYESTARGEALGLVTMEERARLAGGQFDITSASGAGTRVSVWLPFEPAADGEDPGD
jgi:PAS domain S-box-containing protein